MKKTLSGILNWWSVIWRLIIFASISMTGVFFFSTRPSRWAMYKWCSGCVKGLRIRLAITEHKSLSEMPQCVYIANHSSALDIPIIGSTLTCDYRWLAKSALFKSPFLGWHLALSGHIPVHRGKKREKNRDLDNRIGKVVKDGASLLFFPEGTRSKTGHLMPFKLGAFKSAIREGLPITPLYLIGAAQLMTANSWALDINHDHVCSVQIFVPIDSRPFLDDVKEYESEEDKIHQAALALREHCQQYYAKLQEQSNKDTAN